MNRSAAEIRFSVSLSSLAQLGGGMSATGVVLVTRWLRNSASFGSKVSTEDKTRVSLHKCVWTDYFIN